ncbi:hypothetical protein GQ55_1G124600 [Panicum hallii var. hallii]|uniref:Uncharacterized protein n=1 Tax=Panicum hallii var. hallii TaxID=1504633 RepID=A0A2T7F4Z1_9POAL|nr:hypothetical protein GQ55_1G124600 [Panicum hallii var. hallii]
MNIIPKTIGVFNGINECVSLSQWVRSAVSSVRSQWVAINTQNHQEDVELDSQTDPQEQTLQEDEVLQLQSDLRGLMDTLPVVYSLIDRAEWKNHEQCVAEFLPMLKDAVCEAEDLIDEFVWYELKVSAEGNATSVQPYIDFFRSITQGSFNKVTDIQKRLNNCSSKLKDMGLLHQVTPRFDKAVRPETSSFPTEPKMFGREEEVKQLIKFLGRTRSAIIGSANNQVNASQGNNETIIPNFSVLPIVGLGGVGKTTLAQNICNHPQVKSHFDMIIWICVSDDFDVKRLTKEAMESYSKREVVKDNLNSLQGSLAIKLKTKRLLHVLDDMWHDALRENGQCWKRFCAPLKDVLHGSMILVTTRSQNVADQVHTMDPIKLDGLKEAVFWDFFKHSVFGLNSSQIEPELERIGRDILPKLMGSPLAAKTETDILPALRLSYIYLPLHLKRCFSFCAVYPKDHKFQKQSLAEIWIAEGFVKPRVGIPIENISHQYFDDLVNRSFFEKHRGTYVIHDLMHDMAQLVSKDECFTIKIHDVPPNVRHLLLLPGGVDDSVLLSLGKHRKLRTLLLNTNISLLSETSSSSIGNLKHLRYLKTSRPYRKPRTLPSSFYCLYNLQVFDAEGYPGISLPSWFQPQNLQNITSLRLSYGNRLESISVSRTMQQISRTEMPTISDNASNDLKVCYSPNIYSRTLLSPSLKTLKLIEPGNLIGGISSTRTFSSLRDLTISFCCKLLSIDDLLTRVSPFH